MCKKRIQKRNEMGKKRNEKKRNEYFSALSHKINAADGKNR